MKQCNPENKLLQEWAGMGKKPIFFLSSLLECKD